MQILSIAVLLIIDAVFLVCCLLLLLPLSLKRSAAYAVFKRNVLGYFNNPGGYVFLCVFVLLCSFFTFWPYEFFNSNLANLDQLNTYIPGILLVFIPTVTMSIWADERRQGTDELLLTIPATDWDIVIGKYLAAVGIFTISLLVSQMANFVVLNVLAKGDIDIGLFATTYLGYWFMGLSMLALGMVASFLTNNLTVGFILGLIVNAPFVFLQYVSRPWNMFSFGEQMFDFSRGVVSLRAIAFFLLLASIGLYLSAILIGRRHWYGGKDGESLFGHYMVRAIALVVTLVGITFFLSKNVPLRLDATSARISSLSPDTKRLLGEIDLDRKVLVEAFVSPEVPDDYAQTRSDLITKLNELSAKSGKKVEVRIYDNIEPFSDDAARAEEQFGITPTTVNVTEKGAMRQEPIFLGAAFTSGLEKVVVPFFDRGIPVEYELIRSIRTASQTTRPRLGVLNTDARLFGGFDMQSRGMRPKQLIITELEKQYEVVQVDATSKITEKVDVLLAVQPSSLNQVQMDNFVEAVRSGVPTAIFEDPMPAMIPAPGTGDPKPPQGGMMGMGGGPPEPKGNINALFSALGIEMFGSGAAPPSFPGMGAMGGGGGYDIIWQDYNPYIKIRQLGNITPEWVFVAPDMPSLAAEENLRPFPEDNYVTSGLKQLLFIYPGGVKKSATGGEGLYFMPLVNTSKNVGTISSQLARTITQNPAAATFGRKPYSEPVTIAAGIFSDPAIGLQNESLAVAEDELKKAGKPAVEPESGSESAGGASKINAIFVADIDCVSGDFLMVRAQPPGEIKWKFDNVTFVLNVIDVLAKNLDLVDIRKRQTRHSTLKLVEDETSRASEEADDEIRKFEEQFKENQADAEKEEREAVAKLEKAVNDLKQKQQEGGADVSRREFQRSLQEAVNKLGITQQISQRRQQIKMERLTRDRDRQLKRIRRELNGKISNVQDRYKWLAVLIPPIPPLILGLTVFLRRRMLERESITDSRRR